MYIIVNNTPINIYYSSISKVIENNIDNMHRACDAVNNPDGSGKYIPETYKRLGRIMYTRHWVNFEEVHDFSSEPDIFMQVTNRGYNYFKAILKEGYFFYIEDNMNFVVSKLYSTKEEANKSLNAIIEKMNEITSKDIKFDI